MAYAALSDLYALGLAASAFRTVPRPLFADPTNPTPVNGPKGTIILPAHGWSTNDLVRPVAPTGGALPGELSAFQYYAVLPIGFDMLQLAAAAGGTPITFLISGVGNGWGLVVDPENRLQQHLNETAAEIDECLTAEDPPITPYPNGTYPQVLVGMNARMAARLAISSLSSDNPAVRAAKDRLDAKEKQDLETLHDWKMGRPINVRPPDQSSVNENGAVAGRTSYPAGWTRMVL